MGMFDTIIYQAEDCIVCGNPLHDGYQSKDGDCELQELTPEQLLQQAGGSEAIFYGYCLDKDGKLGHCNEFRVIAPQPMQVIRFKLKE